MAKIMAKKYEYYFVSLQYSLFFGAAPDYKKVIEREARNGWHLNNITYNYWRGWGPANMELIFEREVE